MRLSRRSCLGGLLLAAGAGMAVQARPGQMATLPQHAQEVLRHYGVLVFASYNASLQQARAMQASIDRFLARPEEAALAQARNAWLQAREWYGQTEAFRFYGGPIDGRGGPEGRINAWPIDESYIDYVAGHPQSGIVNDRRIALSIPRLAALNERQSEANISTGWHAIEFLLWGQDLNEDGPGRRSASDYRNGAAPHADRRRQYLRLAAQLLVADLAGVAQAWAPGRANYRARFAADAGSLRLLFIGLGTLVRSELAGERLEVALDTQQQEDEHSCFSDNTHRDFVAGLTGVRNVWRGEFTQPDGRRLQGPGPRALVAAADDARAAGVDALLDEAMRCALAIQAPFDREIVGDDATPGRVRAFRLLAALRALADGLAQAAASLGLKSLRAADR